MPKCFSELTAIQMQGLADLLGLMLSTQVDITTGDLNQGAMVLGDILQEGGEASDLRQARLERACWARAVRDTTLCAQDVLSYGMCVQAFRKLALEWVIHTCLSEQPWLRCQSTCPRPPCLQWSPQLQKFVWHALDIVPMLKNFAMKHPNIESSVQGLCL